MMRRQGVAVVLLSLMLSSTIEAQNSILIQSQVGVAHGRPAIDSASTWRNAPGSGVELNLAPRAGRFSIFLDGESWSESTMVLAEISNTSNELALVWLGVFPTTGSGCDSRVAIPPGQRVKVLMPLRPPTEHRMLTWPPFPGVEGSVIQTYNTLNKTSITMFRVLNMNSAPRSITVHHLERLNVPLTFGQLADGFGQLVPATFPGKLEGEPGPNRVPDRDGNLTRELPFAADEFGAFAAGAARDGSGRWTVGKVGSRWSIFTPQGRQFFSFGVNEAGIGTITPVENRSHMFGPLPPNEGETAEHYSIGRTTEGTQLNSFNFYTHNLEMKYGPSWVFDSAERAIDRMKSWGLNTVGANGTRELTVQNVLPSMLYVGIGGNHQKFNPPGNARLMHDPYDPTFPTNVRNTLEPRITERGRHPHHLGIFVDNEMPWGYKDDPKLRYAIPIGVLRAHTTLPSRQKFIQILQTKYGTISRLNAKWGTTFASWDWLKNNSWNSPRPPLPGSVPDFSAFTMTFANQYFMTISQVLADLNYQGLNFGTRFENRVTPDEVIEAAKRWCDVLSFTVYSHDLDDGLEGYRSLNKPILICEFGFSSADRGRMVNTNYPTLTSEDQISAVRTFLRSARTWPNVVGVHYYRWSDCAPTGRTYDGGNGSTGLVSITDFPYQELVDALREEIGEYARQLVSSP